MTSCGKCQLCGGQVEMYGMTTCKRCRGTAFMVKADAQPESMCAHEFGPSIEEIGSGVRTCLLCGGACAPTATTCDRCRSQNFRSRTPDEHIAAAKEDARMFGVGFVVDGKRVSPQAVVVVREAAKGACGMCGDVLPEGKYCKSPGCPLRPGAIDHAALMLARANESAFEQFWLREGPSLAWDKDRKRAARRIWDAARK